MTRSVAAPALPLLHTWRLATAVRVFALALVLGQLIGGSVRLLDWIALAGLGLLAATCCFLERPPTEPSMAVPVLEVAVAALLVVLAPSPVGLLSAYLAAPGLAAGLRLGARAVGSVAIACGVALVLIGVAAPALDIRALEALATTPWLLAGLGSGLLAAFQTRAARQAAVEQAPYAAAHHLLGQLHVLAQRRTLELDLRQLCDALHECAGRVDGAARSSLWVRDQRGEVELLSSVGGTDAEDALVARAWLDGAPDDSGTGAHLPLRVGDEVFGLVLVRGAGSRPAGAVTDDLQQRLDELAVRLETALLVERLRALATSEERHRLARDLHDGVAQRLAALGFVVDDLVAAITERDPDAGGLAEDLRAEVTGIVQELRFSVSDLRQEVDGPGGLAGALSASVRGLRDRSHLEVHLTLDVRGPGLAHHVEAELLRVAQEAMANAHRHAAAANVWVRLTTEVGEVVLEIEDDGTGVAAPRPGHFGLHTMRERAERIGATLVVGPRHDGGTTVSLRRTSASPPAAAVRCELVGSIPA